MRRLNYAGGFAGDKGALVVCSLAGVLIVGCASTPPGALSWSEAEAERTGPASDERPGEGRLPRVAEPVRYALTLRVDPREERFSGNATLHLRLPAPTRVLYLHALDLDFDRVEARLPDGSTRTLEVGPSPDPELTESGERTLHAREALPAGELAVHFEYRAPFADGLRGFYRMEEEGRWYASTQFQVADARRAFPVLDEPGWKVPFEVTLEVPDSMEGFANTDEIAREPAEEGWRRLRFAPTEPIASYLVAFAVGPYDVVTLDDGREPVIRGIAAEGKGDRLQGSLELHREVLDWLEDYFQVPFAYGKIDALAAPEFAAGAMENPGLIIYREELLLSGEDTPERRRASIASVIAHELAHQWFGNLVTLAWWDDLWLNEAFAEWMARKAVEAVRPQYDKSLNDLGARERYLAADARVTSQPIRQPWRGGLDDLRAFGFATFKGSMLLSMLEAYLGEGALKEGIREYVKANAGGSATSDTLFDALAKASDKDVRAVMSSFIDRAGVPLVEASLSCGERVEVRLAQRPYRPLGVGEQQPPGGAAPRHVPVCVAYPAGPGDAASQGKGTAPRVVRQCGLLDELEERWELTEARGCPAWVHPNAGETGYYRWTVPTEQVPALTEATLAGWGRRLEEANTFSRYALLTQLGAAMEAGELGVDPYLASVERVLADGSAAEARSAVEIVTGLAQLLEGEASSRFEPWVRRVLEPRARALGGWEPASEDDAETRRLRGPLLRTLALEGSSKWAAEGAVALAARWLEDPASTPPELVGSALDVAARRGALPVDRLLAALDEAGSPSRRLQTLGALASVPAGEPLARVLDVVLTDRVRKQDVARMLIGTLRPETLDQLVAFVRENLDALVARGGSWGESGPAGWAWIIGATCTPDERDALTRFFVEEGVEPDAPAVKRGRDHADACIAWRRELYPELEAWVLEAT